MRRNACMKKNLLPVLPHVFAVDRRLLFGTVFFVYLFVRLFWGDRCTTLRAWAEGPSEGAPLTTIKNLWSQISGQTLLKGTLRPLPRTMGRTISSPRQRQRAGPTFQLLHDCDF